MVSCFDLGNHLPSPERGVLRQEREDWRGEGIQSHETHEKLTEIIQSSRQEMMSGLGSVTHTHTHSPSPWNNRHHICGMILLCIALNCLSYSLLGFNK